MTPRDQALAIVRSAEEQLRNIVSRAAETGDYTAVVEVASWAKALADIAKNDAAASNGTRPTAVPSLRPKRSTAALRQYPRFFRNGERLIRVAWSKQDRAEYEQRVPRAAVNALVAAVSMKGADGRVFNTEELLPLYLDGEAEVPAYQAYAALGFLKQVGLIDQHGRRGYSLFRPSEFPKAVDGLWRSLPER